MKQLFAFILFLCVSCSSFAQQLTAYTPEQYHCSNGDTLLYRLLRPETEQVSRTYPLVLFLHGAGERGNDNAKQLTHGSQMFLNPATREQYPAYVLMPQCPADAYWAYIGRPESLQPYQMPINQPITKILTDVKELLDHYLALPQIDKSRIYIVGLSMGAMGTYDLTIRFPELFAAAVPICGTVHPDRLKAVRHTTFRIFHGDADSVVPVDGSRQAYKALKKAGATVRYTEFPGCDHGSWNPAFNTPDFMEWLFRQRKSRR
ncbi:MAG: phospholipase [Bacteroidia bacterium]|nr:phospholipase [Bacteroidia bacterium]